MLRGDVGAFDVDDGAEFVAYEVGAELHLCNGSDGGEGFAAEAHGVDGEEVVGVVDFAGGVAFEAEAGVAVGHAAAVVNHLQEGAPGILDDEVDLRRPGVHGVFQQLLDGAGGAVDHLASGNLVCHAVG